MSKWVFSQIMQCVEPMHPVMQSIIEEYVAWYQTSNLSYRNSAVLIPLLTILL